MAISGSDNQEATRVTNENIRIANEAARVASGALIKSGGSMTGDLNLLDENGVIFNEKFEIKCNTALNAIEILAL